MKVRTEVVTTTYTAVELMEQPDKLFLKLPKDITVMVDFSYLFQQLNFYKVEEGERIDDKYPFLQVPLHVIMDSGSPVEYTQFVVPADQYDEVRERLKDLPLIAPSLLWNEYGSTNS